MSDDIANRRQTLQAIMREQGVDAFLIASPIHMYYMTDSIIDGYFYLPAHKEGVLFIRRPVTPVKPDAVFFKSPKQLPGLLAAAGFIPPRRLALEDGELTHAEYTAVSSLFPSSEVVGGSSLLYRMRMIKSRQEIAQLREGAKVHDDIHRRIPELYRDGMTDWMFSVEIERLIRSAGHLGIMRCAGMRLESCLAIVLSGDNAQTPSPYDYSLPGGGRHPTAPMGADGHVMRPGDTVSVDFCGNINGYLTDLTRTYAVGFIRPNAAAMHNFSLSVLREIERIAHPGVLCRDLYTRAWEMARQAGYADCFMGSLQQAKFIGHGIGLQVNEPPVLSKNDDTPLAPGMVIAVEPKLVCPGVGPVGVENTYLVTEDGLEKLTCQAEELVVLRKDLSCCE